MSTPTTAFKQLRTVTQAVPAHPSQTPSDSRALYYSDGLGGRSGNWVDESAQWGTWVDCSDEKHHLAKVRVAGSNPVFRSLSIHPSIHPSIQRSRWYGCAGTGF